MLSLHSHFQLRREASLATFLSHAAFALFFCCLGSGICPFDFYSSALDHGHTYKNPFSVPHCPIEVQTKAATIISKKKKKKESHRSILPRRVDCIYSVANLAFFEFIIFSPGSFTRLDQQSNRLSRNRARHGLLGRGSDPRHNLIVFHMSSIQSCWVHIDFCE